MRGSLITVVHFSPREGEEIHTHTVWLSWSWDRAVLSYIRVLPTSAPFIWRELIADLAVSPTSRRNGTSLPRDGLRRLLLVFLPHPWREKFHVPYPGSRVGSSPEQTGRKREKKTRSTPKRYSEGHWYPGRPNFFHFRLGGSLIRSRHRYVCKPRTLQKGFTRGSACFASNCAAHPRGERPNARSRGARWPALRIISFSKLSVLSPIGSSKPSDAAADGRSAVNANGKASPLRCFRVKLAELYATSSFVGDPIEVNDAGGGFSRDCDSKKTLRASSVKANIGPIAFHGEPQQGNYPRYLFQ